MRKVVFQAVLCLGLCACSQIKAQQYLSPSDIDLSPNGKLAFITASSGNQVLLFDTASRKIRSTIKFPCVLTDTAITPDGRTLFVTGGGYKGRVFVVDALAGKIKNTIGLGHTPMAPVLSPDGNTLYVCNRFNNTVAFVDLKSGKQVGQAAVLREPVAMDVSPDGRYLFVANHNPEGAADLDYVASQISVIDTQTKKVKNIPLVNGAEGVRGVSVSPDGKYMFATHLMARFLVPTTQLERGWVSTDALSVIRIEDQSLFYTVLLDDVDRGFPNPWAIGFSGDGKSLLVSSAGSHEISLIDLAELTKKIAKEATSVKDAAHLNAHNNLSFLSGIRHRIPLKGNGPRAIAVAGNTAYVAHYFSDSVDVLDISNPSAVSVESVELNPGMEITQVRQGEIFFNDAALCFQEWLSCATCHPDARTDALNWDLLNDGMGNPKNVKSMLLSHKTPRAMWLGVRADAETAVRKGITHIQFAVRPEEDAVAIDEYLKSLKPEPSPYLVNGKPSKSAQRGKKVFENAGCTSCHPAPLYTDLEVYDVGTTKGQDIGRPVDVPSLIEAWRTGPYLHDGRAATMHELLTKFDHAGTLDEMADLSEKQIDDLVEFLLSL